MRIEDNYKHNQKQIFKRKDKRSQNFKWMYKSYRINLKKNRPCEKN